MKEKQRITISGNHWDEIIKLPCFYLLEHDGVRNYKLHVLVDYFDGHPTNYHKLTAAKGDTLVEYENGKWGLIPKEPYPNYTDLNQ